MKQLDETVTSTRVLIVDDEPGQLGSLKELVSLTGYQVEAAASGVAAIDFLTNHTYEVMLLDLKMPDMSGYSVIDFVMKNEIEVKIIVVSGESNFDAVTTALRQGAYDFIKKPYMADELLSTIKNAAHRKGLEVANKEILQKLEESEFLHRFIVDNSPDVVFMLDSEGRFTFLNDTTYSLLGYDKSELIGKHYSTIVAGQSTDQARYVFMERRSGERKSRHVELKFKCKDQAEYRYFDTSSMSVDMVSATEAAPDAKVRGTYGVARDITERKQAEELIKFQAYHDLLTHLPNRTLLEDRLSMAITQANRNNQKLAVMFLDLDRFKWVNDTLGHAMGDRLLQSVSRRLENCLRRGDTLARFGGDEFALVLPQIQNQQDAIIIAEKMLNALKDPFEIDDHELYVTSSIGIALYPDAGESMDTLIQSADIAMYHIKERSKNGYQLFDDAISAHTNSRLTLERELRVAMTSGQLRVCYQPQVKAATEEIVGFEALVRWEHPKKGVIFPGDFIPIAEETGLILQLGNQVLETACSDLSRWRDEGLVQARVSINFSALQVDQDDFIENIVSRLSKYNIPGSCLEVEITENVIMSDMTHVIQKLRHLTRLGIKIAIDDFGTGYSSLSYLQQFPISTLKIDKSFISSIQASDGGSSIVDAIVAMAKGLKLNLIAEGVENHSQLDYLKDLGCHEIQGFLFGRAENADTARRMLLASDGDVLLDGISMA
jgi:diguanylate cyclase (GGDEF)-like protein/PAS domain S-box-containing protein